ncbi:MAG: ABC transporter substrate-binding protein, partial [Chloroflexota bacterium]
GLKVDTQRFNSGGDMVVPLAQGDLAAGAGATSAGFYNAILRGIQIKIVADKGTILPDWNYVTLMVRKDLYDSGALHDYKDLKGKKIAITAPESSNAIQLDAAMRKGGATLKDAQTVILSFADMGAAFSNKSIDAGIVSEPFITRYKETNLAVNLGGVADFYPPGQETAIVMYSPKFATDEAAATRFMTAYIQGARDYNDAFTKNKGKDQVISILAKDTTVTQPDLWNRMALAAINPNGEVDTKSLQRDLDWYESEGNVKGKVDLSDIIDTHFAKAVVDKLGRYS